jgi:DNA-binding MarR family transcriptional regulator
MIIQRTRTDTVKTDQPAPRSRARVTMTGVADPTAPRSTYLVKQLQELLLRRLDDITGEVGLTTRQYTTLSVLAMYPGISSAQLARLTFVSPQAANEIVQILERKRLLRRTVDRANRRQLEVTVTRAGTGAIAKCDALVDQLEEEVFGHLSPDERDDFRRSLQTCAAVLTTPPMLAGER